MDFPWEVGEQNLVHTQKGLSEVYKAISPEDWDLLVLPKV